MKEVTLKEFIDIAKDNDELKHSVADCVKASRGGQLPDDLLDLAAGAGYQLTDFNLPMSSTLKKGQILTDTEMGIINAGVEAVIDKHSVCAEIYEFFGLDPSTCY